MQEGYQYMMLMQSKIFFTMKTYYRKFTIENLLNEIRQIIYSLY